MNEEQEDFLSWVSDPARTNDELFTVELLIEMMRAGLAWPFRERKGSFEEEMQRRRRRAANPAYRPKLAMDEVAELARQRENAIQFRTSGMTDRMARDLTALRFFPGLEQVDLTNGDVRDLRPLAALEKVKGLTILEGNHPGASHPIDLAQCGAKPTLERVTLALYHPWPDLRALAQWPIREVRLLHVNVLAAAEVAELPAAELVEINGWADTGPILRDLGKFPAMPKVRRLRLYRTASLEGLERYPTLLNLEIGGPFTDLEPLTRLPKLTALTLAGEHFMDLTPLTRMPRLRELHLMRERPIDVAPLTEAPELRRLRFSRCAIVGTEVGALNAGLLPEGVDFEAAEPRALGPLKFYKVSVENEAGETFFRARDADLHAMREKFYDGDEAMRQAEGRSFSGTLHAKLNQLLGHNWGLVQMREGMTPPGYLQLGFKRYQDTARIREILQLLREESARSRFPWLFLLMVEPHGDMSYEMEQLKELEEQAKQPEGYWLAKYYTPESTLEESAAQLQQQNERYEYLEREHLLRLQEQQGMTVDLELVHAVEDPESGLEEEDGTDGEEPLSAPADNDDEAEGGVAIAPPPPAPPDTEDLSDQLRYAVHLYEDCVVVRGGIWEEPARYNLGEAPVEWTPDSTP